MDKVIGRLTVFFEDPFWVGVFERIENGRLSVAKVTFGAEPKEPEVLIYLLRHYYRRGGGNEDFFAVDSVDFDAGTVDAAMLRSRAVYLRALAEAEQVPELNSDALTAAPGVGQSTAQVVHNVDDLAAKR